MKNNSRRFAITKNKIQYELPGRQDKERNASNCKNLIIKSELPESFCDVQIKCMIEKEEWAEFHVIKNWVIVILENVTSFPWTGKVNLEKASPGPSIDLEDILAPFLGL